ncbi:MAG: hypothetical protein ACFB14_07380 [Leptolyngbyaceae cyanobacterium]
MISKSDILQNLQQSQLSNSSRLSSIWTTRYLSKNSSVKISAYVLEEAASSMGRRRTVERLHADLLEDVCRRAAVRTKDLYAHYENINLNKTSDLARSAQQVYPLLLEFYCNHTPIAIARESSLPVFAIPEINILAKAIEPYLTMFNAQNIRQIDWQIRSFLTTEFNLSGKLLLEYLSPAEQVLLSPYISFLEEYVAIPWHRVCALADNYAPTAPEFKIVERVLPQISEISIAVYTKGCELFGGYYNRRGQLDNPGVRHSSLRDMHMFQVYLWTCLLQGNLDAIEQELLVLCTLVYRRIDIPWEMAIQATKLLSNEIMQTLTASEQLIVSPYINGMIQAFKTA